MEFHKKYRPTQLNQVIGQPGAISQLKGFVDKKQVPHAVLFTGPSGCGKTTLARIMAKSINCGDLDTIEMNMADDRGIETVRKIQETLHFRPLSGGNRTYILDEFHAITAQAGQAFLKLFEDMPSYIYFFVCSSEPQKIAKALQTRLTKVAVNALAGTDIGKLIDSVCEAENIDLPPGVKGRIVGSVNGSARAALVTLGQLYASNFDKAAIEQATQRIGDTPDNVIEIARNLMTRHASWTHLAELISAIPEEELEGIRWMLLRYAEKCLRKPDEQAVRLIEAMSKPFFDGKRPEFLAKCYRVYHVDA